MLAKYQRQQGNMSLLLGNRGIKLLKLQDEKIVSKFMKRKTNKESVWGYRVILEGNKDPPLPQEVLNNLSYVLKCTQLYAC